MLYARILAAVIGLVAFLPAKPAQAEPVRLVTGDRFPPFAGRDLPEGGLATLLVKRVFKAMGRSVTIHFKPWDRGLEGTLRDRYDGAFPFIRSPERTRAFLFSGPVVEAVQRPLVRGGAGLTARRLKDLEGHSFCLPVSYAPAPVIAARVQKRVMGHIRADSMDECLRLLDRGRVAFIPMSEREGRALLRRSPGRDGPRARFLDMVIAMVPHHVLFNRDNPQAAALRAAFDATLNRLRYNGTLARLKRGYLSRVAEKAPVTPCPGNGDC